VTRVAYRIVDVFSDRPLAGNALCVVTGSCPEHAMQAVAREVNLSETTFPTVTGPGAYRTRIFTPGAELPFAGHPTLGTAWVIGAGEWVQSSAGGEISVTADADGAVMQQPSPTVVELDPAVHQNAAGLHRVAGCWLVEALGLAHVVVATEEPIGELRPDLRAVEAAVEEAGGGGTFAVVHRLDDRRLHVRVFAPGAGVPEDPGTGSAAGPIATVAHRLWGTSTHMTIHQGTEVGRPCTIEVELTAAGPLVGGRVTGCAEGVFLL
jgi:trans-2,3-dihydro-3-hydroxyanthranilate isomerase